MSLSHWDGNVCAETADTHTQIKATKVRICTSKRIAGAFIVLICPLPTCMRFGAVTKRI